MTVDSDLDLTGGRATARALDEASATSVPATRRRPWLRGMRARDAVFQKLLVVVFAKVTGGYGRDEMTLRKSTLEELPAPHRADGETVLEAVRRAARLGIKVSLVPRLFEVVGSAVAFDTVGGVTVLGVRRPGLSRGARLTKRIIDVCGSALCMLLLAPVTAIVAITIKLGSPGPVLFRQQRVGRDGETFGILKFRSVTNGAETQRSALELLNETSGTSSSPPIPGSPRSVACCGAARSTSCRS